MRTDREYGLETRLILKILQDAGVTFVKTTSSDSGDHWGPAGTDMDYYGISCEGLSIGKIAYNLWNLEDSMLIAKNRDGERTWARFIYGNSWGELMGDWLTNLFGTTKNGGYAENDKKGKALYEYMNWSVTDVLRHFGINKSLTEIVDEQLETINRGSPLIVNEADSQTGTQEESE